MWGSSKRINAGARGRGALVASAPAGRALGERCVLCTRAGPGAFQQRHLAQLATGRDKAATGLHPAATGWDSAATGWDKAATGWWPRARQVGGPAAWTVLSLPDPSSVPLSLQSLELLACLWGALGCSVLIPGRTQLCLCAQVQATASTSAA